MTEGILWDTMGYRGPQVFIWMGDQASLAWCKWAQQVLVSLPSIGFWGAFSQQFSSVLSLTEITILLVLHGHPVHPADPVQLRTWDFCAFSVLF